MGLSEGSPIGLKEITFSFDSQTRTVNYDGQIAPANRAANECLDGHIPHCDRCSWKEFSQCPGQYGSPIHGDATEFVQPKSETQVVFTLPPRNAAPRPSSLKARLARYSGD